MATDMIARAIAMSKADLVDGKVPASELPETSIDDLSDTAIDDPENGEVLKYDADQGKWVNGTASGGGGTSDYTDLTNKPKINNVTLSGSKTGADLGLVDAETGKGLSTEDYTTAEKSKLSGIESGAEVNVQADWDQADSTADDYIKNKPTIPEAQVNADWDAASGVAQILNKPTIPTVNNATLTVQKNGASVGTFTANASSNATINITVPTSAADVSALPASTKYGATLTLAIDSTTYVVTATLKDQDGNTLGNSQTIDLPLETMVVSGSYDSASKKVVLTLKNGSTVEFSVADLISGLQSEITAQSPLDADLVDDSTSTNKFVTDADKTAWNAKSNFSGSYNDLTDKPTIPAAQVNSDWSASSGAAQILNKPTLGTAAALNMDTALSGSSVNPVQNKAVKAETDKLGAGLAEAINVGAKNVLMIKNHTPGQEFSNGGRKFTFLADGGVKITGTATGTGNVDCYLIGSWSGTSTELALGGEDHTVVLRSSVSLAALQLCVVNRSTGSTVNTIRVGTNDADGEVISFDATAVFLSIGANVTVPEGGIVVYPMICPKALFAASPDFAQYAPTNRELYEMILAMQNGGNS